MNIVHGKQIFESLEELVKPEHTAVLVVDMQNDLVSLEGLSARRGGNPSAQRDIIPALQNLLKAARKSRTSVVYIQVVTETNFASMHPASLLPHAASLASRPPPLPTAHGLLPSTNFSLFPNLNCFNRYYL